MARRESRERRRRRRCSCIEATTPKLESRYIRPLARSYDDVLNDDAAAGRRAIAEHVAAQESLRRRVGDVEYEIRDALGQGFSASESEHMLPGERGDPVDELQLARAVRDTWYCFGVRPKMRFEAPGHLRQQIAVALADGLSLIPLRSEHEPSATIEPEQRHQLLVYVHERVGCRCRRSAPASARDLRGRRTSRGRSVVSDDRRT